MQKHLIHFKRSSGKLINQIKGKLKMVKQDSLVSFVYENFCKQKLNYKDYLFQIQLNHCLERS